METLRYNYHDAIIDKVKITETTLTLYIDLYSIFYPCKPKIELWFDITADQNKCRSWTNKLLGEFDDGENYLGARIENIDIQAESINVRAFLCKIRCNNMELLTFKSLSFKETEIGKEIFVEEQLLEICQKILKEN